MNVTLGSAIQILERRLDWITKRQRESGGRFSFDASEAKALRLAIVALQEKRHREAHRVTLIDKEKES